jgi:hypothetical protein
MFWYNSTFAHGSSDLSVCYSKTGDAFGQVHSRLVSQIGGRSLKKRSIRGADYVPGHFRCGALACSRNISEDQIEKEKMNLVFTGNNALYSPAALYRENEEMRFVSWNGVPCNKKQGVCQ